MGCAFCGGSDLGGAAGRPHFHGGVEQGARVGSRWTVVSSEVIRIISGNIIIQRVWLFGRTPGSHSGTGRFRPTDNDYPEASGGQLPVGHVHVCTRAHTRIAGMQAHSLGFHSTKEFVSTFQARKAGKQGEAGGPGNA